MRKITTPRRGRVMIRIKSGGVRKVRGISQGRIPAQMMMRRYVRYRLRRFRCGLTSPGGGQQISGMMRVGFEIYKKMFRDFAG
jgi:hypothetical protein